MTPRDNRSTELDDDTVDALLGVFSNKPGDREWIELERKRLKATCAIYDAHHHRNIPIKEISEIVYLPEDVVMEIERDETNWMDGECAEAIVALLTRHIEMERGIREFVPDVSSRDCVVVRKEDLMALFGATREQVDAFDFPDGKFYPVGDFYLTFMMKATGYAKETK